MISAKGHSSCRCHLCNVFFRFPWSYPCVAAQANQNEIYFMQRQPLPLPFGLATQFMYVRNMAPHHNFLPLGVLWHLLLCTKKYWNVCRVTLSSSNISWMTFLLQLATVMKWRPMVIYRWSRRQRLPFQTIKIRLDSCHRYHRHCVPPKCFSHWAYFQVPKMEWNSIPNFFNSLFPFIVVNYTFFIWVFFYMWIHFLSIYIYIDFIRMHISKKKLFDFSSQVFYCHLNWCVDWIFDLFAKIIAVVFDAICIFLFDFDSIHSNTTCIA